MYLLHNALIRSNELELAKTIRCSAYVGYRPAKGSDSARRSPYVRNHLVAAAVDSSSPSTGGRYSSYAAYAQVDTAYCRCLGTTPSWTTLRVMTSCLPRCIGQNRLTLFRARREKNPRQWQVFTLDIQVYPPLPQNPLFSWIHGLRLMSSRRSRGSAVEIAETDDCRAKGQQGLGSNYIGIIAAAAQPPNFPLWPH